MPHAARGVVAILAYLSLIRTGVRPMAGLTTFLISTIPLRFFAPNKAIFLPAFVSLSLTGAV